MNQRPASDVHELPLAPGTSFSFAFDFSRLPVYPPASRVIQTKLEVNQPGDEYEQEADHLSEQVLRMPDPTSSCACGSTCSKCQAAQTVSEHAGLKTERVPGGGPRLASAPPIVHEVLRSPGRALDPAARTFMEPRFGYDFGRVRIHTDETAAQSARAVSALAYTVGHDIVFAPGQYAPLTAQGRKLLAHELAHVTQQKGPRKVVQRITEEEAKCPLHQRYGSIHLQN